MLEISNVLSEDLKFPVKFNENNIQEIFKLIMIEMNSINDRIIFSIRFPLCISRSFNVYHILPIYVLINKHRQFNHLIENTIFLFADKFVKTFMTS